MTRTALLLLAAAATLACERKPPPAPELPPVGVPDSAVFYLAAPTLTELAQLTAPIHTLPTDVAADAPAWLACTPNVCALRRAAPATKADADDPSVIADGDGALVVVWGAIDPATVDTFRAGKPPATDRTHGALHLRALLQLWKPEQRHAQALVAEASDQVAWLNFDVSAHDAYVDLRIKDRPASSLGAPTADFPTVTGIPTAQLLGALRLSAAPPLLWALFQHTLTPERRTALDAMLTQFTELGLDVERDLLATLTGQAALFYFDFVNDDAPVTTADVLRLTATEEALILGVEDTATLRRTLDALTQISQADTVNGSFVAQSIRGDSDTHRWAWMVDDTLRASVTLTPTMLAIVDSVVAQEQFEKRDQPLDEALSDGVGLLLHGGRLSGLHLNTDRVRHLIPQLPQKLTAVTITIESDDAGAESTRIRLAWKR